MVDIVTYHAQSANVKSEHNWVAYIVLPNGEYLGVMFRDYTEEGVKAKALQFWQTEASKRRVNQVDIRAEQRAGCMEEGPVFKDKAHLFAGKVWMRHKDTRDLVRVPINELDIWIGNGYEKSGPRSK